MNAWAAGFFDGEGSVSLHFYRGGTRADLSDGARWRFRLRASGTDRAPLDRLLTLYGGGVHAGPTTRVGRATFAWAVEGERAVVAARAMIPHATTKRERLELFVEAWDVKQRFGLVPSGGVGGHTVDARVSPILASYAERIAAQNQKGPRRAMVWSR